MNVIEATHAKGANVFAPTRAEGQAAAAGKNPAADPRHAALDGLRGLAILLVLAGQFWAAVPHATDGVWAAGFSKLAGYGGVGVALFLVLSGFGVARSLIRSHGRPGFFGGYFLRRACRILPVYALLLGGSLVAVKILFPLNADLWEPTVSEHLPRWSHAAFMQNIFMALTGSQGCTWLNPTWFLAVTVQFYLLMPVVVWLVAPRWLPVAAAMGIVACWLFRAAMHAADAHVFLSSLTLPGRADSLFIGVLAACAWENARMRNWLKRSRVGPWSIVAVSGVAFLMLSEFAGATAAEPAFFVAGAGVLSISGAAALVVVLAHERSWLARALAARPLRFWGAISFFVFLAHQPVNSLVHGFVLDDWPQTLNAAGIGVTLVSIAGVALLGLVSRRWLEQPLVVWSQRLSRHHRTAAGGAAEGMPESYSPPLVRWARGLAAALGRPTLRVARAVVRVRL